VLVLAAIAIGSPILRIVEGFLHRARFDSISWKANALDGNPMWPTRLRMVDDLMERHLLDGRSREEVESLLGPGPHTPLFPDWDVAYRLGPERSFYRIDSEWLVIRLDSSGRVKEYRLTVD
jgi:hypothetical protein